MSRSPVWGLLLLALGAVALGGCGASVRNGQSASDAASVAGSSVASTLAMPLALETRPLNPLQWGDPPTRRDAAAPVPNITAMAAVVMDEASAAVLYERDPHRPLSPASLTKIATAAVALRDGDLDAVTTSDVDGASMRGSTIMGVAIGDRLSLRNLLYGLMLPSGNDAALVIARQIAGTDTAFIDRMNRLATELGMRDTTWTTPHGLGGASNITSAYDLAILSRYAMSVPGFAPLVQAKQWTITGEKRWDLSNINSLLYTYPGADGVKTGYTRNAGKTIVASATRNRHRVYVVLLNDPRQMEDAAALLDWAFANHLWRASDAGAPPVPASEPGT